jgi:hypothetical protein
MSVPHISKKVIVVIRSYTFGVPRRGPFLLVYPLVAVAALVSPGTGDEWNPPSEASYESENGKYVFQVLPEFGTRPPKLGSCRGSLYARQGGRLKPLWNRPLINNVAPLRAIVSDSGEYVVTISEWASYEQLPIAFYGRLGLLLNVYGRLEQIAPRLNVPGSGSGRDWLHHALLTFGPHDATFVVRLSTKLVLAFETSNGEQIDENWRKKWQSFSDKMALWDDFHSNVNRLIMIKALMLSCSASPSDRETGEFILKQQSDAGSISLLREIAQHDPTFRIIKGLRGELRIYPIREAASRTLAKIEKGSRNL